MFRHLVSIGIGLALLTACGVPDTSTPVADQPSAAPATATSTPAPAAPTLVPATPSSIPATPSTIPATPSPAPATPSPAAVTPSPQPSTPTAAPTTPASSAPGVLTGTVSYPAGPLPANAKLTIRLIGIPGIGQVVFDEQVIGPVPAGPVPFTLAYDPASIDPIEYPTIYVEAIISDDEIVMFRTDRSEVYQVLNPGKPTTATLELAPPTNTALLNGTIRYPADFTPPADATLTLWVLDSRMMTEPLSQRTITPVPAGATQFRMQFFSPDAGPAPEQILHATLRSGGKILLMTNELPTLQAQNGTATLDLTLEAPAKVGVVSGTVVYPADTVLPADAEMVVQLLNEIIPDGGAVVAAEQLITPVGASPVPFSIEYDPRLTSDRGNSITAAVSLGDRQLLGNERFNSVELGSNTPITVTLNSFPNRP